MNDYIDFLEKYFGEIQYGWTKDSNGEKLPFQIIKCTNGTINNTACYSTLGLNSKELKSNIDNKKIRHELIFLSDEKFGDKNIPGILQQIGLSAWTNEKAYLRGEVIGPKGKIFEGTKMEALYVSSPVYFPDEFHVYDDGKEVPIINVWMFPITLKEARFIKNHGWKKFEDLLLKKNPDLIDLYRDSII